MPAAIYMYICNLLFHNFINILTWECGACSTCVYYAGKAYLATKAVFEPLIILNDDDTDVTTIPAYKKIQFIPHTVTDL